eukprot:gene26458-34636_t
MRGVERAHHRLVEIARQQLGRDARAQEIGPQKLGIGRVDLGIAAGAADLAGERAIGVVDQLGRRLDRGKRTMKLSDIADNAGSRKKRMRVGRGIGSGKGKQAGRGGKGQTARSGVRIKGFEGGQMPLHRRLPKRGFNNIFRLDFAEINLDRLQDAVDAKTLDISAVINAESLVKARIIRRVKAGIRVLGRGEIKAKLNIEVHGASKSAIEAIEKAGGTVKILAAPKKAKDEGEAAFYQCRAPNDVRRLPTAPRIGA